MPVILLLPPPHLFGQCGVSNWLVKANFLLQACFPGAYVSKKCSLNLFWITKLNVQNLIYFKLSSVRQNFSIFCFFYILIITYSNMCVDFVAYLDQSCVAWKINFFGGPNDFIWSGQKWINRIISKLAFVNSKSFLGGIV